MVRTLLDPLGSNARRAKYNGRRLALRRRSPRELEGRQLETLLERYFTDDITETSLPTARHDNARNLTKSRPNTVQYETTTTGDCAVAIRGRERDAQFLGRQGGVAADYVNDNFRTKSDRLCRRADPSTRGASDRTVQVRLTETATLSFVLS